MTIQIRGVYPLIRLTTALALMTLGCSAMYAGVMVLEPLALEFDTGRGNSSLIYSTFMIGFALGGVVMGRLADRMGIMIPALIGSLALPAGFYLAAHASSILEIFPGFQFIVRVSRIIVQHGPAYRRHFSLVQPAARTCGRHRIQWQLCRRCNMATDIATYV